MKKCFRAIRLFLAQLFGKLAAWLYPKIVLRPDAVDTSGKTPIYTLGSADPRFFLESLGGTDSHVLINGEYLPIIQAVSFFEFHESHGEGSLVHIGPPNAKLLEILRSGIECKVAVEMKDEFGHQFVMERVAHFESCSWGVAIDDIITESTFRFSF